MRAWFVIVAMCIQSFDASPLLYEELKAPSMHPRTFYLTSNQEFLVISKVLCADIPCPEFNVVQDYPYFIQQRIYHNSLFLTLNAPRVCNFKEVLENGFQRLENYTKGSNIREEKYRMTLPVLIRVHQVTSSKSKNPWCHMSYSMNYYTPHYWGAVAPPKEFMSKFLEIPDKTQIYVHTFDGDVERELLKEIELFRRNLDMLNLCYKKMTFYVALYEITHSPQDSRYELWFLKCNGRK